MSLVAWWPLHKDLNNLIDFENPLVVANGTSNVFYQYGKIGGCRRNSSNTTGTLRSTKKMNLGRKQSMFCWIYMESVFTSSYLNAIMGQHRYQNPCGLGLTVRAVDSSSGYVSMNTGSTASGTGSSSTNGGYRTYNNYRGSTTLNINKWYHLGYTYDNGTICLYVNGEKETIYVGDTSQNVKEYYDNHLNKAKIVEDFFGAFMWSFSSATVGDTGVHGNYDPKAMINDIRVYDHALSAKEVKEIYKTKIVDYCFNDPYVESTTNLISSIGTTTRCTKSGKDILVDWTASSANYGDTYFFMNLKETIVSGQKYSFSFDCEGIGNEYVTFAICNLNEQLMVLHDGRNEFTFTANDTNVSSFFFDDKTRTPGLSLKISNIQLEKKDHCTPYADSEREDGIIYDISGYGNDALNAGCVFQKGSDTTNVRDSLYFNGSTSYVQVPNFKNRFLQEDFTMNFWVKESDSSRTIYFGDYELAGKINFNIEKEGANPGALRVYYNGSPNNYFYNVDIIPNEWTMLTLAYDRDAALLKVYHNGIYKEELSVTTQLEKMSGYFRLGRDSRSDSTAFLGNMSDFTVYATCLTDDDILKLYQSKFEITSIKSIYSGIDSSGTFAREFEEYVKEDGVDNTNLVYNGNLTTQSNEGFSVTSYNSTLKGIKVIGTTPLNDDFIEINENDTYKLSLDYYIETAYSGTMYFALFPYDVDKKFIDVTYTLRQGMTTLAADLVSGATTLSLTSGTSWATSASASHMKYAGLCCSTAYNYNRCTKLLSITDTSGNTSTLKSAYSGVTIPAGTKIANFYGGNTYYYPGTLSASVQSANVGKWIHVEYSFKGSSIRYGTRYVKLAMLSYTGSVYWRNIRLENTSNIQLLQRNADKKENIYKTKRYKTSKLKTLSLEETGMNIRYIKDTLNGSTANSACHWVEVQAFNSANENVLFGRSWQEWTETSANLAKMHMITNETTTSSPYWEDNSNKSVTFDLGSVMNIKSIKIWHYWSDSRKYNNKTMVSSDGTNWITVFDSAVDGVYTETSDGHEILLNPVKTADYRCGKVHTHNFFEK